MPNRNAIIPSWLPIIDMAMDVMRRDVVLASGQRYWKEYLPMVVLEEFRRYMAQLEPLTDDNGKLNISTPQEVV
tara:strand:+ start:71 stop:292 length:222 start_codon:yes stop_codon:yes gene_type:complete